MVIRGKLWSTGQSVEVSTAASFLRPPNISIITTGKQQVNTRIISQPPFMLAFTTVLPTFWKHSQRCVENYSSEEHRTLLAVVRCRLLIIDLFEIDTIVQFSYELTQSLGNVSLESWHVDEQELRFAQMRIVQSAWWNCDLINDWVRRASKRSSYFSMERKSLDKTMYVGCM